METNNKDFQLFRALEISALFILMMFVVFFIGAMVTIMNAFQNEVYANLSAGLKGI